MFKTHFTNLEFLIYIIFTFYAVFKSNLNLSAIIAINSELVGFPLFEFTV